MDTHQAYKILNLDETASFADAKKAYRCLAKKYHPDITQSRTSSCDDTKMKEINLAFVHLTPVLRSKKAAAGPAKATDEENLSQTSPGSKSQKVHPKNGKRENENTANENRVNETGPWHAFFSHVLDKLSAGFEASRSKTSKRKNGRKKPVFRTRGFQHKKSFDQVFEKVHKSSTSTTHKKNRAVNDRPRRNNNALKNYQTYMKFKKRISAVKRRQNQNICVDRVEKINPIRPVSAVKTDE